MWCGEIGEVGGDLRTPGILRGRSKLDFMCFEEWFGVEGALVLICWGKYF